ncbi:isochorismate synthase [Halalkalicoccus jeotgali]|uniref:isochorismate synthase n=1 Tax=Halalkalicoccus jeotgali (strain DSM 18796 / CECT 7217 / JCM 14584 / KCTC 4019 / B3) TaxID=795797 RepID=D8J2U8_HALJB|nr:isochorismate synthase [Halalkalicoccus jeotgali]ADJ15055.1 isochorismate synthase [Halalkalicoccus jeotgali B3]ELY34927.1 isochorismate synthase [Halalkalicoccus jeotgali B3]
MTVSDRDGPTIASAGDESGPVVSRACEVVDLSYRSFLADRAPPRVYWTAPHGLEIAGGGAAARLRATGDERFETLRADAERLFSSPNAALAGGDDLPAPARPRAFGGVAFHAGHDPVTPWEGFPAAEFVVPRIQLTRTDETTWLTVSASGTDVAVGDVKRELEDVRAALAAHPAMQPSGGSPGIAGTRLRTSREEWTRQVQRATDRIAAGELRKVVLAQSLEVDLASGIEIPDVLERLRRTYPECYRFLIEPTDAASFFGAPPERLVSLSGRRVETEALAGSVARGETPEEDHELMSSLFESEKIRHEQGVVVDTIREQLEPLGEIRVDERTVRKLATIQHLRTPIRADLADEEHVLSIVEALHPTPAVGGLPPERAWETIRGTETFDRGWYASPVGWFDADGDGEFAVAIRSGVASDARLTLFAGNGIVADSDPDEEWAEVQLKYRPILDALGE